ncbi:hypothetical protein K503DRAFT_772894, partial [Rhizopogon vinicolor AM-OR11-026]
MLAPRPLIVLAQKSVTILLLRTEIKILHSHLLRISDSTSNLQNQLQDSGGATQGHTPLL